MGILRRTSNVGGANLAASQKANRDGRLKRDGLEITLVDISGDFQDQRGPFAPATTQPGSRMLGAIIPVEGELYFIKAVGPEKTD